MRYWTIEHPRRGVLTEVELVYPSTIWTPHFQWSKARYVGREFYTKENAVKILNSIQPSIRDKCKIVEWNSINGTVREVIKK